MFIFKTCALQVYSFKRYDMIVLIHNKNKNEYIYDNKETP